MNLISISVKNFRCYGTEITIPIANLTTFVGKNDIGKSTILEALEIFFNNQTVKCEQDDLNIHCGETEISITCEFSDLPSEMSVDAGATTSLAQEFLLTSNNTLKIKKIYDCSKKVPSTEIFIISNHPTVSGFDNLLELKEKDLQA